ncbi:MAG TPA: DinB family protein [Leeuwenhoekiella sp.]|nr:DinB family protein [Leeuwenhoekiella sp.]
MDLIAALKKEFDTETQITRKFLKLVPEEKYHWAPHTKSMSLKQLSGHIAELPYWVNMAVHSDGLDFAKNEYQPPAIENSDDLLSLFEKSVKDGKNALNTVESEQFTESWQLKNGDQVLWDGTTYEMIRHALAQQIHHRAQLGVYLRLLDIPIPGSYGPSADDQSF